MSLSPESPHAPSVIDILARVPLSIVALVDALLVQAHRRGASDIHVDPTRTSIRVRFRIDGMLVEAYLLPLEALPEVIGRIKILAAMRTDEHRIAQDGRFRLVHHDEALNVRVSIAPTFYGEHAVLRILADPSSRYTLESLGFSARNRQIITASVNRPHGMLLATGPTGSGKTTTLYALISMRNAPDVSILTIEDPIEYAIDNVDQIQVNASAGLTFATGLRSILRQDPNIIMVGEIRDTETASIAVNTALAGHLLLSTLHTNDAATSIPRLIDMGIDPYLVASTLSLVIGQRLVRRLCPVCREEYELTAEERQALATLPLPPRILESYRYYRARSCMECGNLGYRGRLCISEVLVVDARIRDAVMRRATSTTVRQLAVRGGMITMLEDGFDKACAGHTTIQEVLRVVYE